MEIAKLRIKTEEGEKLVSSLFLVAGLGIEGDKKAKGGDRQICLADEDELTTYRQKDLGLCVNRFMPNISTRNLDYKNLQIGTQLNIGNAVIEITSTNKKCFPECELIKAHTTCEIAHSCAFAKVLTSGEVTV